MSRPDSSPLSIAHPVSAETGRGMDTDNVYGPTTDTLLGQRISNPDVTYVAPKPYVGEGEEVFVIGSVTEGAGMRYSGTLL